MQNVDFLENEIKLRCVTNLLRAVFAQLLAKPMRENSHLLSDLVPLALTSLHALGNPYLKIKSSDFRINADLSPFVIRILGLRR